MKKKILILIGVLCVIVIAVTAGAFYLRAKFKQTLTPTNMGLPPSVTVTTGDIKDGVFTSGTVKAKNVTEFQLDQAKKTTIKVKHGQEVKKGQLLYEIIDLDLVNQYNQAVLARDKAKWAYDQALAMPAGTERDNQVKTTDFDYKAAELQAASLAEKVAALKVYAPFSGLVTISSGKTAEKSGTPTIKLISMNELIVPVPVEEEDYPKIKKGDKVNITLSAFTGETFFGTITYLGKEAVSENGSVSFPAEITLEPNEKILPGMTAEVWIVTAEKKSTLLLPLNAVQEKEQGKYFVELVIKEGQTEMRDVEIGLKDEKNIEIISGLKEGDKVISPTEKLDNADF